MRTSKILSSALLAIASVFTISSCDTDNDARYYYPVYPNALVTVKPIDNGGFYLQLDDSTTLYPVNVDKSPYGDKEVRALAIIEEVKNDNPDYTKSVKVAYLDSIRTKPAVALPAGGSVESYGSDPIELVNDWVNVAEDGYLTLRFRTRWGNNGTVHYVNLITGSNPDDPYEVVFTHNANGDINGMAGDALVAFKIKDLPETGGKPVKLTLRYKSYEGEKTVTFDFRNGKSIASVTTVTPAEYSARVK